MATIFSRIAAGEIPSYRVAEDDRFFAFLDINPEEYADFTLFAKRVAAALEKAMPCKRIGVCVIGLEVPHAHIHLVPLNSEADMDFRKPKLSLPAEQMQEIAAKIAENFK